MKKLILLGMMLVGCSSTGKVNSTTDFDWMPDPIQWENNIRNCRSQPQCNAADLFRRN